MTVKEITEAIDKLFDDTSVSQEQTLDRMQEIRDHLDMNVMSLKEDMEGEEG